MHQARLPIDEKNIPEKWGKLSVNPSTERQPLNLQSAMALRGDDFYLDFLKYVANTKKALKIPLREQEMIILRIAHLSESDYVWGFHVPIAKEAGMDDEEILDICKNLEENNFSERDRAMLNAVDEMLEERTIEAATYLELEKHLTREAIFDIVTITSQYFFFATFNNAFRIPLEKNLKPYPEL